MLGFLMDSSDILTLNLKNDETTLNYKSTVRKQLKTVIPRPRKLNLIHLHPPLYNSVPIGKVNSVLHQKDGLMLLVGINQPKFEPQVAMSVGHAYVDRYEWIDRRKTFDAKFREEPKQRCFFANGLNPKRIANDHGKNYWRRQLFWHDKVLRSRMFKPS